MQVLVADSWRSAHPGARVGMLALRSVRNPALAEALAAESRSLERSLREQFAGRTRAELSRLPTLTAYNAFYKRFGKSYHVQLQLESVVLKGKPLASASALVQAMFMAELGSQLLTAGHDLDRVVPPLTIAAATGGETYTRINGQPQALKAGDMYTSDAQGILSSVIYGPDERTQLRPDTTRALYVTYAPVGIETDALWQHLRQIESYVRLVAPESEEELIEVFGEAH